jgi:transposase
MRQKSNSNDLSSEEIVKGIRRATRKRYSAEEKIRIVLDGLRGEISIAELCRSEGIAEGLYYSWSKEFLAAGRCASASSRWRWMCRSCHRGSWPSA